MLIAGVAVAAMAAAAAELQNASFEDPDNPDDVLSDKALSWGRWGNWINRETGWTPTHSGNCLIGYHHFRIESPDDSGIYQDVSDIPEGKSCTFKVYALRDPHTNIDKVEMRLEPCGGGATLASTNYLTKDFGEGKWVQLSIGAVNPTKGIRALIIVTPDKNGERKGALKFDDAELVVN